MALVNSGKLNDLMTSSSELRFSAKTLKAWKAVWCLRDETEVDELVRLEEEADNLQTQITQKFVKLANITEEIWKMRNGDVSSMNNRVKDLWQSRNGFTAVGSSTLKPSSVASFRGDTGSSSLKPKVSTSSFSFCSDVENKGVTTNGVTKTLNSEHSASTLNPSSSSPTAPTSDEETTQGDAVRRTQERRSKELPRAPSAHMTDSNSTSAMDLPGYMRATTVSAQCNAHANATNTNTNSRNKVNPKIQRAERMSHSPYISRQRDDRDRAFSFRHTTCGQKFRRQSSTQRDRDRSASTPNMFPEISKTFSRCTSDHFFPTFQRGSNHHQYESPHGRRSAGDCPNANVCRGRTSKSPPRSQRGQNPGFSFSAPGTGNGPVAGHDSVPVEEDPIASSPVIKRNVESAKARVLQALLSVKRSPEHQRGSLIKALVLQWHPDKHPQEDRFFATRVFQYLQDQRVKMGL